MEVLDRVKNAQSTGKIPKDADVFFEFIPFLTEVASAPSQVEALTELQQPHRIGYT